MISEVKNIDCMIGMKEFPDKFFDLAIVDPPYGINAPKMSMGSNMNRTKNGYPSESTANRLKKGRLNSGGGHMKNSLLVNSSLEWDIIPDKEYFSELFRVSKNQIIWGGNYFDLPPTRGIICWDKMQPWENFSQWEMAWSSFDVTAKMFRMSNTGGNNHEQKIHPTQKPIQLYGYLLKTFAEQGDKILDTHLGSGSSRIASYKLGFDFWGFEIDKQYYDASCERFDREIECLTLCRNGIKVKQLRIL